jgi:hypothetical protein
MNSNTPQRLLYWQRARLIFGTDLPATFKLTLLALSDHLGSNDTCYPSVQRLQLRTGYSRRTVLRALEGLEQQQAISVSRATGRANVYSLNVEWLQAHQCHTDTSATVTPVPERHGYPCHSDTTPVPQWHPTSATVTPKGDHEGDHEGDHSKEVSTSQGVKKSADITPAKKARCLTREQAAALPIPAGLPDGYADAFRTWCQVRKGTAWRQAPEQIARTHQKLLRAYTEGKDVVRGLERAIEAGWQGINVRWLEDLPKTSKPRKDVQVIDYAARYRQQLLRSTTKEENTNG